MLQPATVRFDDWIGTAAADGVNGFAGAAALHEAAGLDRERWRILAVEFEDWRGHRGARVYALDATAHDVAGADGLATLAGRLGHLPVVRHVLDPDRADALAQALSRLSVQLISRDVRGVALAVEAGRSG